MKLKDKMFSLAPTTVKLIEKQLKKDGVRFPEKWYKKYLCFITSSDEGDTFFTLFSKEKRELFCSCAMFNEVDDFDSYLGEVIAVNRMARNLSFVDSLNKKTSPWVCKVTLSTLIP